MAYQITPEDLVKINDLDAVWGTVLLLPKEADIPDEFWSGNAYTQLADAIFRGRPLPPSTINFKMSVTPQSLNKCVRAHLKSFEPRHEHKIAGVGFLISQVATLEPTFETEPPCAASAREVQ